jgi:hypothetical protein
LSELWLGLDEADMRRLYYGTTNDDTKEEPPMDSNRNDLALRAASLITPDADLVTTSTDDEDKLGCPCVTLEWDWGNYCNPFDATKHDDDGPVTQILACDSVGGGEGFEYEEDTLYDVTLDGVRMLARLYTRRARLSAWSATCASPRSATT